MPPFVLMMMLLKFLAGVILAPVLCVSASTSSTCDGSVPPLGTADHNSARLGEDEDAFAGLTQFLRRTNVTEVPHEYTFPELAPASNPNGFNEQPYLRVSLLLKKKAGVSEEFYHRHWKSVHADLALATEDFGVGFLRYVQFHLDSRHRQLIAPLFGDQVAPYDGVVELYVKDFEQYKKILEKLLSNTALQEDINDEWQNAMDISYMAGYENLIFGSAIQGMGGTDGILASDPRLTKT